MSDAVPRILGDLFSEAPTPELRLILGFSMDVPVQITESEVLLG